MLTLTLKHLSGTHPFVRGDQDQELRDRINPVQRVRVYKPIQV